MKYKLVIVVLVVFLILLVSYYFSINENYVFDGINKSSSLEISFNNNTQPYDKFDICYNWSLNYYDPSINRSIKFEQGKSPVVLKRDGETYNILKRECPSVLNRQMLNELKVNVLQPFNCSFDYNKKGELNYYKSSIYCYTGPTQPYSRGYFGDWSDPVGLGCSTRDNLLYKTAENKNTLVHKIKDNKETCTPNTGEWKTYFDDGTQTFTNASDLDIDHTVPLKNAWLMGGYEWKPWQLESFANDMTPGHLEVMEKNANITKNDKSIDDWNPKDYYKNRKNPYLQILVDDKVNCNYAANYAAVKHRWNLKLTGREYDKLEDILTSNTCKSILPKEKIHFEKKYPKTGLGISLQESLTHPEKIQMYGIDNINFTKLQNIRNINNKDVLYKYCNNSGSNPEKK